MGVAPNRWFIMDYPTDDLGVPPFQETCIYTDMHSYVYTIIHRYLIV